MEKTESEKLFASLVKGSAFSDADTDKFKHIDIITSEYTVDVKGIKKVNRWDEHPNPDIHWIEFVNVRGKRGWLFGEADYIAFEQPDHFVVVDRKKLASYCKEIMKGKKEAYSANCEKQLHTYYFRPNRNDIIILLHISEINNLKEFIVGKK